MKGDAQIEALEKIYELLNNIPRRITTEKEKQVTFDETTAPPQETNVGKTIPATKPKITARLSITKQWWTNQSQTDANSKGAVEYQH